MEEKFKVVNEVYPTKEELATVNCEVQCPEKDCSCVFTSESNLNLHLAKTHKKEEFMAKKNTCDSIFYCPETPCDKNFKSLKLLKQHYLKVHSEKSYVCEKCQKGFATPSSKKSHNEYCGVLFNCQSCASSYSSYESLLTHARRKKHKINEKNSYKNQFLFEFVDTNDKSDNKKRKAFILPKGSVSMFLETKTTLDKSNQTDCYEIAVKRVCLSQENIKNEFTLNKTYSNVETQTIGDSYPLKKPSSDVFLNDLKKSSNTQTQAVSCQSKSCNTSFNLNEFQFDDIKVERNNSNTQTTISVPTEFIYSSTNFDDDLFNNIETQTDFLLNSDDSDDYCISMCTQTCEMLLNDLGFNNICTQTGFDDILKSVQSQTNMSHSNKNFLTCRDMAHMETQTENEFKLILEQIQA